MVTIVTLIGGYSCTGKTKLALRLMKECKIPYFSIDYLKMGIFRSNKNCGYTPLDDDNHIAKKLWPIIREMVYTYIENGQDIVIEGCYIQPEQINDIAEFYKKDVKFVFIGLSENYIRKNFETGILANKGTVENRTSDDERPIFRFIQGHEDIRNRAITMNQKVYTIHRDYLDEFDKIYKELMAIYE